MKIASIVCARPQFIQTAAVSSELEEPVERTEGSASEFTSSMRGKRAAVVVFSHYPSDPRPHRAAEALKQQGMDVEVIAMRKQFGSLASGG
jgi:hypothetical protein